MAEYVRHGISCSGARFWLLNDKLGQLTYRMFKETIDSMTLYAISNSYDATVSISSNMTHVLILAYPHRYHLHSRYRIACRYYVRHTRSDIIFLDTQSLPVVTQPVRQITRATGQQFHNFKEIFGVGNFDLR